MHRQYGIQVLQAGWHQDFFLDGSKICTVLLVITDYFFQFILLSKQNINLEILCN